MSSEVEETYPLGSSDVPRASHELSSGLDLLVLCLELDGREPDALALRVGFERTAENSTSAGNVVSEP